jgi:hypothetical protein
MGKLHEATVVAIFVALSAAPALSASPTREVSIKEAADYAVAESGAKLEPAWGPSDEAAALGGRVFATRVLNETKAGRTASDLPIATACGVTMPAEKSSSMRLLYVASTLRREMNPTNAPLTDQSRRMAMVAMNRIESYSQGYADSTRDVLNLIFAMSPETKAKFCTIVRSQQQ